MTSADIAHALPAKGFDINKKKIEPPAPLKALGESTVRVKIHRDVTAQVKVRVAAETHSSRGLSLLPTPLGLFPGFPFSFTVTSQRLCSLVDRGTSTEAVQSASASDAADIAHNRRE